MMGFFNMSILSWKMFQSVIILITRIEEWRFNTFQATSCIDWLVFVNVCCITDEETQSEVPLPQSIVLHVWRCFIF